MPNTYFETGFAVCAASIFTTIDCGTGDSLLWADAAHPAQSATVRTATRIFIDLLRLRCSPPWTSHHKADTRLLTTVTSLRYAHLRAQGISCLLFRACPGDSQYYRACDIEDKGINRFIQAPWTEGEVRRNLASFGRRLILGRKEFCSERPWQRPAFPSIPERAISYLRSLPSRCPRCFSKKLIITLYASLDSGTSGL